LVACKVSMLALLWLPLAPAVAAMTANRGAAGESRVGLAVFATVAGVALGFALGAPGAVLHPQAFRRGVEFLTAQYAGLHPPYSHVNGGSMWDVVAGYFRATLGWPALAAGAAGLGILIVRRRWSDTAVVAGPVVLFVGYFATKPVFFERNLSHVLPLFCVLAGLGAGGAAQWAASRLHGPTVWFAVLLGVVIVAKPAELTRRLVWLEFSGRGYLQHTEFETKIRADYPKAEGWTSELMNGEPLDRLTAHFHGGGGPILLRMIDYCDEWSAREGQVLSERFDAELVGRCESDFADVPGCTLHTYNSWTDRYYLVRGVKTP
jgi:hypothetical protein